MFAEKPACIILNRFFRARPQYELQTFNLLTTFPSKELSDNDQTLDEAGILNAAVLQRLA
jgi:UBX domain-containing protein 1